MRMIFSLLVALPLVAYGCSDSTGGSAGTGGTAGAGGSGGQGGSGGALAECDPLLQDCEGAEGCYVRLDNGEQLCAPVFAPGTQGDACDALNACDVGYGCNLLANQETEDRVCAFFCDPDGGAPSCADGPGPAFDCRRINGFWDDAPDVSLTLGMCLDPLVFPDP